MRKGNFFAESLKKAKNARKITAKITSKVGTRRKSRRINMRKKQKNHEILHIYARFRE